MFVIDVSHASVTSGMLTTVCTTLRETLDALPGEERTLVGILTFDRWVPLVGAPASERACVRVGTRVGV